MNSKSWSNKIHNTDIHCLLYLFNGTQYFFLSPAFDTLDKFLVLVAFTVSQIGNHLQEVKLNISCKENDSNY